MIMRILKRRPWPSDFDIYYELGEQARLAGRGKEDYPEDLLVDAPSNTAYGEYLREVFRIGWQEAGLQSKPAA
jgi:hypothetical protein